MIELTGLTKKYGSVTAVDDVSTTIAPGIVTGFLGPNGAGKSTPGRVVGSASSSLDPRILIYVPLLQFPTDRIVGVLDWDGSWTDERGPVLATGSVQVPADVRVNIRIQSLRGSAPTGAGSWSMIPAQEPVDLGFLRDLPPDAIESVSVRSADDRLTAVDVG